MCAYRISGTGKRVFFAVKCLFSFRWIQWQPKKIREIFWISLDLKFIFKFPSMIGQAYFEEYVMTSLCCSSCYFSAKIHMIYCCIFFVRIKNNKIINQCWMPVAKYYPKKCFKRSDQLFLLVFAVIYYGIYTISINFVFFFNWVINGIRFIFQKKIVSVQFAFGIDCAWDM